MYVGFNEHKMTNITLKKKNACIYFLLAYKHF